MGRPLSVRFLYQYGVGRVLHATYERVVKRCIGPMVSRPTQGPLVAEEEYEALSIWFSDRPTTM